jgi:hypothetical protein
MARIVLIPMATAGVVLWSLMTLLENIRYIHDPSIPAWQVVALAAPSVLVAVSWGAIWMRSPAYTRISLENPVTALKTA